MPSTEPNARPLSFRHRRAPSRSTPFSVSTAEPFTEGMEGPKAMVAASGKAPTYWKGQGPAALGPMRMQRA